MKDTLISRDSKGKCRVINISCEYDQDRNIYTIKRSSGLLNGKLIVQPEIIINKGKVKRTLEEQATLEYNSIIKKQLDKGYKRISDLGYSDISEFNPDKVLPKNRTDTNNIGKPMLCKVLDINNKNLTEKQWISSFKHDGTRCLLYWKDNEVKTASRGGQDYDLATTYIRQDPYIISLFKNNPNLILDGEIYRHGWTLNVISGLCRLESLEERHKELKFHCYDIADESLPFKARNIKLNEIRTNCPIDSKLVVIKQTPVKGLKEIQAQHDKAISEGYEGLVIRDPEANYKYGARDNRMMKLKRFSDAEFKITGISEGLREEDMCFTLETKEGYPFKAKPIGTREDKQWYREHISELIGKMGTVKYFGMTNTDKPVPNLPVFKNLVLEKDR